MWNNHSYETYCDIREITNDPELSLVEKMLEILYLLDDSQDWDNLDVDAVTECFANYTWTLSEPTVIPVKKVGEYILKPLDKLTLAEWIDLDSFIQKDKSKEIVALVLRKYKEDEWGNIVFEPYLFSCSSRANNLPPISASEAFSLISNCHKYRQEITTSYKSLFDQGSFEDQELESLSEQDRREIQEEEKKNEERSKFAWQKILHDVSGGNWSYIEKLLDLPFTFVLNMMVMNKVFSS